MSMRHHHAASSESYGKATSMALIAMGLAAFMILLKGYLYATTGAASFLASLLDSVMDIFLSASSWVAVRWASKPADANHRYGHGKIEALGGIFQALLIGGAAFFLAWHAGVKMTAPEPLTPTILDIGLSILILATTTILVMMQSRVVKDTGSVAISGDRAHYTGDIVSNAGLLFMLVINYFVSIPWLDPLLTIAISVVLVTTIYEVAARSVRILLDHEVDEDWRQKLMLAAMRTGGVDGVHDFRAIESGMRLIITMDIEVDPTLSLIEAHDIARDVEYALLRLSPNAEIIIHVDPKDDIHDSRHADLEPHHFS